MQLIGWIKARSRIEGILAELCQTRHQAEVELGPNKILEIAQVNEMVLTLVFKVE